MAHKRQLPPFGEQFIKTGLEYIPVGNPEYQKLLRIVEEGFLNLIQEDLKYRNQWGIKIGKDEIDLGLLQRKKTDRKDVKFILQDKYMTLSKYLVDKKVDIKRYEPFLKSLKELQALCINRAYDFANILDKHLPGYSFAKNVHKARELHTLRLNAYIPRPGEIIAREHTDRCTFTFHLYQSHPGLMFKFPDETEALYDPKPHELAVFPGKKIQIMTGGSFTETIKRRKQIITSTPGIINALPHYVRQSDFEGMRVSAVFFTHTPHDVVNMK